VANPVFGITTTTTTTTTTIIIIIIVVVVVVVDRDVLSFSAVKNKRRSTIHNLATCLY
jgi:hypothetical protein